MDTYTISQLARAFGLSRSTLLYYDRIGLLRAWQRTAAGYRRYTRLEHDRLARICMFRATGMALADVQKLLDGDDTPTAQILEKRLRELEEEMRCLKSRQHLIIAMLKKKAGRDGEPAVDKKMWVEMMAAAGMDDDAMQRWHAEFESRAPEAHFEFLMSLGIAEDEARQIRKWSRGARLNP